MVSKRILVTGGAGFIGSAVCRHLISQTSAFVLNLDKLTYAGTRGSTDQLKRESRYHFVQGDIADLRLVEATFADFQPDGVIHLAAETHVDRSITGAATFIQTNILGTYTLLDVAREYWVRLSPAQREKFRFLQVSTDEVYGSLGSTGFFSEVTPYDPSSPYSATKAAADHLALAWQRTYGLPVMVSNCSNNYGPYQFPEKLIPLMILNGLEGKPLPVYGDGRNVRDWLFVDDHAAALALIVEQGTPGKRYNVGGFNERSNLEVVGAICRALDRVQPEEAPHEKLIRFVPDRPGHDRRYAIDSTKLYTELGWRAQQTFDTGLPRTVQWYLENPTWWQPLRQKVYAGERIGLGATGSVRI
jgi:dTDP-glucose 4,6-dehydratase